MELRAYLSYRRLKIPLTYWRSVNGQEVDFLLGDKLALEVKATAKVTARDLGGLSALAEEKVFTTFICVSNDKMERKIGGVLCYHWQTFIQKLWQDEFSAALSC